MRRKSAHFVKFGPSKQSFLQTLEFKTLVTTLPLVFFEDRMSQPHRKAVLNLYKTLLFLGREWPQGYDIYRKRIHKVFTKNSEETDPNKIKNMIRHGEFVVKEIETLYKLKKYRTMKRRYYDDI